MKYTSALMLSFILLTASAQKYTVSDSILITLKNGATLTATVCWNNADTIPLPVILMFNIYASPQINKIYASIAASKGYVGVVVNTRGKRLSQQIIEPFEHDAEDAYEIIDWISIQSWCNGKVGMYGASYLGFSQWASVKKLHPALKTIVPQAAVGVGIDFPMQNNVFSSYMLQWIHYVTNSKTIDPVDFGNTRHWDSVYKIWYLSGRPFNSLDTIDSRPNEIFQRWLKHPGYDDYWKKMTPQNIEYANINIPILTITGYYDADQLGAMYYFKQHTTFNKNANHYLIIGPYDHDGVQSPSTPSKILGYQTDTLAGIKIYNLIFNWFNYTLKDSARPALLQNKINYQVMGANKWEHKSSLSEMNNDSLTFFLSDNKVLSDSIKKKNYYSSLTVNYDDRSDTANMDKEIQITDSILYINKNMLVFATVPLKQDIEMNGSMYGNIHAMLNKKDADLNLQLYELTPDGKYFLLNNNVLRASYTKDNNRRILLKPGKNEFIPISNTFFISKLIKKNSKLVFVIGVNKNYNYQINYGTGKDVSIETISDGNIPLTLKIYPDSFIKIPILLRK